MKRSFLAILLLAATSVQAQVLEQQGKKTEVRHMVSYIINNVMSLSLADNDNEDVTAQRVLVINSNIPCNIVVNENFEGPSYSSPVPVSAPEDVDHGPAVSQISSARKIYFFRDRETVHYMRSLLYTAAQF